MKQSMASLKERLTRWIDWDGAAYELGACLGFWRDFGSVSGQDSWNGVKGVMWSSNPLGEGLHAFLLSLVEEGMLEYDEEGEKFRWNPNYDHSPVAQLEEQANSKLLDTGPSPVWGAKTIKLIIKVNTNAVIIDFANKESKDFCIKYYDIFDKINDKCIKKYLHRFANKSVIYTLANFWKQELHDHFRDSYINFEVSVDLDD